MPCCRMSGWQQRVAAGNSLQILHLRSFCLNGRHLPRQSGTVNSAGQIGTLRKSFGIKHLYMKNISYCVWYAVRYMYTVNATRIDRPTDVIVSRTTHAPQGQGSVMSDTTVTASWVIDRTKRLVDQLPPAELAQQIADIKQQLAD